MLLAIGLCALSIATVYLLACVRRLQVRVTELEKPGWLRKREEEGEFE
jgi:hypothetical protein